MKTAPKKQTVKMTKKRATKSLSPLDYAAPATPPRKAEEPDAPRIEARLVIGELSILVDASSLERTLGAGLWGHGKGLVDAWPDEAWAGLLAYLKLPSFPLDRVIAEQPVKRLVQRLWYEAVKGGVPEERAAVFAARDAEKNGIYQEEFPKAADAVKAKGERAKTSFAKARGGETQYTPTDALKAKGLTLGGQQVPLLEFFKASKFAPATTSEATAGMLAHGLVTSTKPERISAFYLCQWVKKGLLTR